MSIKQIKENKIKMILQFSIPSIIAMLLETFITITDGYFTGNYVGELALAAINLGLPILYFYLGIGLCVGVGGIVICGRLLGAGDKKKAESVFSQTIVTSIIICIVLSLIMFVLFNPILHILKAEGELNVYFTQYYRIMLFTYPLMVVGTIAGMFIRVDGKPQFCMLISIIGCILNVILDAVFVGAFSMGVQGSAVASFIVQLFTVIVSLSYFFSKNAGIHFCYFQFDRKIHQEIVFNGSSEFIGEMASAISMFAFNYVLMRYVGTEGVAAFTILGFAVYVYSMICIGFGQGITPLVSMCWGAQEKETAMDLRIITNNILFVIGLLFAVIFFFFGKMYAGIFGCSSQVVDMVASGFKVYVTTFVIMGYDVINSMYFTSCGDAKSSALISALRGVVLLLAFTLILPAFLGMTGVWLAAPCTEALTAIVSLLLITKQKKNVSMMVLNS
ncbi:MAG: MATE family efflux transporter [Lachnospiraceae bacterium]|nr:MATE family efflux transporter [Lachnospiraceae bacterium]